MGGVRCLKCERVSKNPYAPNWVDYQMCFPCAKETYPNEYKNKRGGAQGLGGKYLGKQICVSMIENSLNS